MKRQLISILFIACCITAFGIETSDEIKALKKELKNTVKIGTVQNNTIRDGNNEKTEQFLFYTNRDENCDKTFKMRVTIELTDDRGKGDVYYASLTQPHSGAGEDFTGEERWAFEIPHGNMNKPKVTAYAIQSGVIHNKEFTPIAEDLDNVDRAEEITERENTQRIDMKCTYHHAQYYTN